LAPLALPGILYLNTVILLASSLTVEIARRKGHREPREQAFLAPSHVDLGTAFLAGQALRGTSLRTEGLYLATSPNSRFSNVLTVLHALHYSRRLFGFIYVIRRTASASLWCVAAVDAAAVYWHFLAGLWVYLLLVLRTRL